MLTLKRTNSDDKDFCTLVEALDIDLRERYGPIQALYNRHNDIKLLETVVVAYLNDQPVGCGCFKRFDDQSVELKRMYVTPAHRGTGIASRILKELETWAGELQNTAMMLETGKRQPEAVSMYQKNGYVLIPNYGSYANLAYSLCMKKTLT